MDIALEIIGGLIALIAGGELLVRGASSLALAAKVSPLIIGLTVVAFGTSAPELGVSINSCYQGAPDLAIGNAVGSNIANVLLVLGASALVAPLAVHSRLFKLDIPVMVAAAAALWALGGFDGKLSRAEGVLLSIVLVVYFIWTIRTGRKEQRLLEAELADLPDSPPSSVRAIAFAAGQFVAGLVVLILGADFLVDGCKRLALHFGASELAVGLVVTAFGTSLPELVTSFTAALRNNRDLAVGNVVGSNILNIFAVLGITAAVAPGPIPVSSDAVMFHIPVMLAVTVCCLPIFLTNSSIMRWEGAALLAYYLAYIGYVGYAASAEQPVEPTITTTLFFIAPLLVITASSLFVAKRER